MNSQVKEIKIGDHISFDLALRASASDLFRDINTIIDDSIVINFSDVRTISRSFAHEYLTQKAASEKSIEERSVPENVRKMFAAVNRSGEKTKILDFSNMEIVPF